MPLRKVLQFVEGGEVDPNDLVKDIFECRDTMTDLGPVAGDPICVICEALYDLYGLILAGQINVTDDPLRALTSLYKLVEGIDKVIIKRSKSLMLSIGFRLPMREMRLVASPKHHRDKLFDHLSCLFNFELVRKTDQLPDRKPSLWRQGYLPASR